MESPGFGGRFFRSPSRRPTSSSQWSADWHLSGFSCPRLESLRSAKIPPGGQLAPESDPAKLRVPPLVEVYSADPAQPSQRLVEIVYRRPGAAHQEVESRVYVPVHPVNVGEVSLTIFWFVCQLSILAID
jgi:hypothetical protein